MVFYQLKNTLTSLLERRGGEWGIDRRKGRGRGIDEKNIKKQGRKGKEEIGGII